MPYIAALVAYLRTVSFIVVFAETIFAFSAPLLQAISGIVTFFTATIAYFVYLK
jgi:hypothetical protein